MHSHWCKDQLLLHKILLKHCKCKHRNMSMAWIHYRKVCHSVSHNWVMKSLELFKVSPLIVNFLKSNMLNWNTALFLSHKTENLKVELSSSKKKLRYLVHWKPFKNDKKWFLFHLKFSFCSQDIEGFIMAFWSCRKNKLIIKIRLISKFMTSQTG